jgi:hypothetical protein
VTDWIKHDGGPQPVADDVWVEVFDPYNSDDSVGTAGAFDWGGIEQFTVLNRHLIDAARLEGIRLGLEAAAREADIDWHDQASRSQARMTVAHIRDLDPATIAKEADQ